MPGPHTWTPCPACADPLPRSLSRDPRVEAQSSSPWVGPPSYHQPMVGLGTVPRVPPPYHQPQGRSRYGNPGSAYGNRGGSTVLSPAHGRSRHGPWVYRPITSPWAGLGTVTPLSACRRALQVGGAIPISYREWPRQAGYSNLPPEIQKNLFGDPWSPNLR